ncbi:MAG: DeoR/GlpR transcriptional regulator [Lachnospiraceae bacterium]|nr:DeoR/GlpR transcriptional regulator [Lachnospiraceae bacterium]
MLAIERRNAILAKLQTDKKVVVSDLSIEFDVTEETIRRDLEKLENEGVAKKTYGGAVLNESLNIDLPYMVRKKANVAAKQRIAAIVGSMIQDGDNIILDGSSTALFVARRIKDKKNITVITNSVEILLELSDRKDWNILSTGGSLKEGGLSLVGYQAERMISTFHVDWVIFSSKGIDIDNGITDSNENDAQIKKMMLKSAKKRVLAIDSSKFDKTSFTKVCEFEEIDMIVTDSVLDESWEKRLKDAEVEIVYDIDGNI